MIRAEFKTKVFQDHYLSQRWQWWVALTGVEPTVPSEELHHSLHTVYPTNNEFKGVSDMTIGSYLKVVIVIRTI